MLCYSVLGHGELMEKMQSLIERVQKHSQYLKMEETVLDDVRCMQSMRACMHIL